MNVIRGRVEVKGTGLGVGGLLVALFDLDPDTRPRQPWRPMPRAVIALARF